MEQKKISSGASNKPVASFAYGSVQASIFENEATGKDGAKYKLHNTVLTRSYKADDGTWKTTNQYSRNELQCALLAIEDAMRFLLARKKKEDADPEGADALYR